METPFQLVSTVLSASDEIYLKVTQRLKSTESRTANWDPRDLDVVLRLIRENGETLHEILCRISAAGDGVVASGASLSLHQVRRYQTLLGDMETSISNGPNGPRWDSQGRARHTGRIAALRRDLAQVLSQLVLALTADTVPAVLGALSQPDQPHVYMAPYDQELVLATFRWLRSLDRGDLSSRALCGGIAISLSKGARSLADVQAVSDTGLLNLCGGLVRRTADDPGLELTYPCVRERGQARMSVARCEIGLACLRMLNFEEFNYSPEEYRREEVVAERRGAAHPFYAYAVEAWMELLPGVETNEALGQQFIAEACRLFSSPGNLTSSLLEVARKRFAAVYPISPAQAFICLTTICTRYPFLLMHTAACFGLARVCSALAERGYDVNARSNRASSPLYCALAGPALLLSDALGLGWDVVQKNFRLDQRLDTAEKLLQLGARPVDAPSRPRKQPSFVAVACMAYAARSRPGDFSAFSSLVGLGVGWADEDFLATFQDPAFPFDPSKSGNSGGPLLARQKQFLNELCNFLLDVAWSSKRKAWLAAWKKAVEHDLECTWPTTRRRVPVDDKNFTWKMMNAMRGKNEPRIRYMMQDTRWDANLPLGGMAEQDRGRTLLHQAVEEGDTLLVQLLLKHGRADVSVSDASGRAPLHLCGNSDVLRLLVNSGADLRQTDNDGRLLWHYAAANNDISLLRTLVVLDPDKEWVLKQTTKQGRTPLAEALAFVRELNGLAPVTPRRCPSFLAEQTQSIWFILELLPLDGAGHVASAYLASDIPVICLAAEWGIEDIVWTLARDFSPRLDLLAPDGSGPLHFLNFSASTRIIRDIRDIPGVAELPVLNRRGHSPAESIFFAFQPESDEPDSNAHPANNSELDESAYAMLLTEEVRSSRDERGRPLWERFCRDVVLHYAQQKPEWLRISKAMSTAVLCLVAAGVVHEHESATDSCAFAELSRLLCRETGLENMPSWLPGVYLQLLRATTRVQRLEEGPDIILFPQSSTAEVDTKPYEELLSELASLRIRVVPARRHLVAYEI